MDGYPCKDSDSVKPPEAVSPTESTLVASNLSRELLNWLELLPSKLAVDGAKRWCAENGAVYIHEVMENKSDFLEYLVEQGSLLGEDEQRLVRQLVEGPPPLTKTISTIGDMERTSSVFKKAVNTIRAANALGKRATTVIQIDGVCTKSMEDWAECFAQDDLSVHAMEKKHCYRDGRTKSAPSSDNAGLSKIDEDSACAESHMIQSDPICAESGSSSSSSNPKALKKTDTVGLLSNAPEPSRRKTLTNEVKEATPEVLDHGQTGSVHALKSGNKTVAIFKPKSGERFDRRGIGKNEGYYREEAAYLVDRLCGSQACVPVTSLASLAIEGEEEVEGSVQRFVDEVFGFTEDYGIPRDTTDAAKFLCLESGEAVALLDMRIFNMDRHGGNLLLTKKETPHCLGPIDHGCCLPPWWCLEDAIFDAWSGWHFLQATPSAAAKEIARKAYEKLEDVCEKLKEIPLDQPSILTLRLCTLFVYIGVYELDLPIGLLASKLAREDYEVLSWFEERVLKAAVEAGAKCEVNDHDGRKLIDVENLGSDINEKEFLAAIRKMLDADLQDLKGKPDS